MIVIINSFDFPVVSKIAQRLAERYEAGTLVDIHEISARLYSRHVKELKLDSLFDEVCNLVSSEKKHGKKNFVMSYIFDNPNTLKQLRVSLSNYDDEIYAFRLSFSPAVLEELFVSIDNTADNQAQIVNDGSDSRQQEMLVCVQNAHHNTTHSEDCRRDQHNTHQLCCL